MFTLHRVRDPGLPGVKARGGPAWQLGAAMIQVMPDESRRRAILRAVKVLHTLAWAFFAGCILAIPWFAWKRQMDVVIVLIAIVAVEVAVLVANRMVCPLTDVAARYTDERHDNFDIYLPLLLARYNKHIFGTLYAADLVYALLQFRGS